MRVSAHRIGYLVDGYLEELGLMVGAQSCRALRQSAEARSRAGEPGLDAIAGALGHTSATTAGGYAKTIDKAAGKPTPHSKELMGLSLTKGAW